MTAVAAMSQAYTDHTTVKTDELKYRALIVLISVLDPSRLPPSAIILRSILHYTFYSLIVKCLSSTVKSIAATTLLLISFLCCC